MSEAKHTPGPWAPSAIGFMTNEGQKPIMSGAIDDPERKRVALVDCQTPFKRGQGHKTDCAERDANARLIAAAPDLLEALSAWIDFRDGSLGHHATRTMAERMEHIATQARAAIAKATST